MRRKWWYNARTILNPVWFHWRVIVEDGKYTLKERRTSKTMSKIMEKDEVLLGNGNNTLVLQE